MSWLCGVEIYNGWYHEWTDAIVEEKLKGFPFVIGVPHEKKWIERAHELGVRVLPYVTFYKAPNIRKVSEPSKIRASPFYKEVDLAKHPEWILFDERGVPRRPFNMPDYPKGWTQNCTNVEGYAEACLRGVKALMDMGVDGLFIDNAHPTRDCYGPRYGKHEHRHPDKDNVYTYTSLMEDLWKLVKSYGSDKVTIMNPGDPGILPSGCWNATDGVMWESFFCTGAAKTRYWGLNNWPNYLEKMRWCKKKAEEKNVAIATLSYIGNTEYTAEEDAFFCYAAAKLFVFLWSDWFTGGGSSARTLYTTRLGTALGGVATKEGAYYRLYEKGLVVVNPSNSSLRVELTAPKPVRAVENLFSGETMKAIDQTLAVDLPQESGRVYVYK